MNSTLAPSVTLITEQRSNPIARYGATGARVLLGLVFFVCGLNGFLNFIPPPSAPMPDRAMAFVVAMIGTGYLFPLVAGTQVLAGALLLANRFVPLALILLAPVIVNIMAYHVFLDPNGMVIALVVLALESLLLWSHRAAYRGVLTARA
jgi:uncharacterized membrane protein YphA (DoxX/SURF4 family)